MLAVRHAPPVSGKLASSRSQSSTSAIKIPAIKPTSLPTTSGSYEAERQRARRDNVVLPSFRDGDPARPLPPTSLIEKKANNVASDEPQIPSSLDPLRSRFENCKEFLRKAYSAHPPTPVVSKAKPFPSSKSTSCISAISATTEDTSRIPHRDCSIIEEKVEINKENISSVKLTEEHYLDEVEIVSLIEEQVPKYKLRADTLTKFGGCENQDFVGIPYPALKDFSPVSPEQAYLTLGYFLLSGQRVSQMTKTFEDVDALQRLLEEKEKDLELAARIGQQLLEQNRHLEEKVTALEGENRETQEELIQLKHDLAFKIQLLEIYNENYSEETSKAGTPVGSVATVLERRVATLEDENRSLRAEACRIVEDVEKTEAEEKILVEDAIKKLSESNSRVTTISDELQKKTEEVIRQQDEMAHIVDQLYALQGVNKELLEDNAVLNKTVEALHGSQTELTTEIADLKENYVEIVTILKETQEQLREAQKQKEVGGEVVSLYDSLAFELESSVARQRRTSDYFRRTFDTVRNVNNKFQDGQSGRGAGMMSSVSSLGYQSMHSSSALPSLDSSHESSILNSSNPCQSLVRSGSDLGSSICPSLNGSSPGSDRYSWRMPEKLQIVKPLEGSSTLQVWSALATPNLGNLLDRRPGVKSRTERPANEIGMGNMLSLTAPESTLPNVSSSTSTVFTFVTTSSDWNRRDSTSTVYSTTELSTMSGLSMTPSGRSSSPCPSACSSIVSGSLGEFGTTESHLYLKCETPQNSPLDGNSFPGTPAEDSTADASRNRTLPKTIYDALCKAFGSFGAQPTSASASRVTKSKKYDILSKLDNLGMEDVGVANLPPYEEPKDPERHQPHHYYRY